MFTNWQTNSNGYLNVFSVTLYKKLSKMHYTFYQFIFHLSIGNKLISFIQWVYYTIHIISFNKRFSMAPFTDAKTSLIYNMVSCDTRGKRIDSFLCIDVHKHIPNKIVCFFCIPLFTFYSLKNSLPNESFWFSRRK